MRFPAIAVPIVLALNSFAPSVAHADDIADVKAAEVAFNGAQNAGNIEEMFSLSLPDRTVYGSAGGALVEGWTGESKRRRQAAFDAGRKVDLKIEDLKVRIYENTAVTTFYRIGTVTEVGGVVRQVHLRISGIWIRQSDGWKLAHRHESPY